MALDRRRRSSSDLGATAKSSGCRSLLRRPLMRNSLSCCVGASQSGLEKLQDYDFLGITDGLLQAGVPSILGYRWPIVDVGGEKPGYRLL
jgi:hypothetical protein